MELTDRMHEWLPTKYSFVFVLIRPTSLVLKEHFFCILSVLTRLVSLISTKTKEYFFGRHLCIRSIVYTRTLVMHQSANSLQFSTRDEKVDISRRASRAWGCILIAFLSLVEIVFCSQRLDWN